MAVRAGRGASVFRPDALEQPPNRRGNPFREIEVQNSKKYSSSVQNRRGRREAVLQAFSQWDETVTQRLRQLGEAVMPPLAARPELAVLRFFCRNEWIWRIWGGRVKYRVVRCREAGFWAIELYRPQSHFTYGTRYLVKICFSLNEAWRPAGFHLYRGSDDKTFDTEILSESDLTQTLMCHFSRLDCGSCLAEDLKYLESLVGSGMISESDYAFEERRLVASRAGSRLFVPPRSARSALKKEARQRVRFCLVCILLIAAALLRAGKFGAAPARAAVSSLGAELLNRK